WVVGLFELVACGGVAAFGVGCVCGGVEEALCCAGCGGSGVVFCAIRDEIANDRASGDEAHALCWPVVAELHDGGLLAVQDEAALGALEAGGGFWEVRVLGFG
ncbi:128_t:CDS:2, partial [Scutellospora calospora]